MDNVEKNFEEWASTEGLTVEQVKEMIQAAEYKLIDITEETLEYLENLPSILKDLS